MALQLTPDQIAAECRRIAGIIGPEAIVVAATHSNLGGWSVQVYARGMIGRCEHFRDDPVPELLRRAESYAREFAATRDGGAVEYRSWFGRPVAPGIVRRIAE